jgi:hypothetical protein
MFPKQITLIIARLLDLYSSSPYKALCTSEGCKDGSLCNIYSRLLSSLFYLIKLHTIFYDPRGAHIGINIYVMASRGEYMGLNVHVMSKYV